MPLFSTDFGGLASKKRFFVKNMAKIAKKGRLRQYFYIINALECGIVLRTFGNQKKLNKKGYFKKAPRGMARAPFHIWDLSFSSTPFLLAGIFFSRLFKIMYLYSYMLSSLSMMLVLHHLANRELGSLAERVSPPINIMSGKMLRMIKAPSM